MTTITVAAPDAPTQAHHDLAAFILDLANRFYNLGGWDHIVECMEPREIARELWVAGITGRRAARAYYTRYARLKREQERAVRNEIF